MGSGLKFPTYERIAMIGRAPSSRYLIPNIDKDTAVFTIAACADIKEIPHIDVVLEIHSTEILTNPRYNADVWGYCKQVRDIPLYLMNEHEDAPAGIMYPFEQIAQELGANVLRGPDEKRNDYYTSSFDYLMALVLMHNPSRVDLYGWNMETDTEFRYQREGLAFWVGLAAGRGVRVWLPDETPVLDSLLYAYEGTQAIKYARLMRLRKQAARWKREAKKKHERLLDRLALAENGHTEKLHEELGIARDEFFLKSGALQGVRQLMERFTLGDLVARQEIERQRTHAQLKYQNCISRLNYWEGVVRDRQNRLNANKGGDIENMFLDELNHGYAKSTQARDDFFVWQGALQLLEHLIKETDLQRDDGWSLKTNIIMKKLDTV